VRHEGRGASRGQIQSVPHTTTTYQLQAASLVLVTGDTIVSKMDKSQGVAHAYNLSYSGDRKKENQFQSQPGQRVHEILSGKKPITKKGWLEWLKV
jgi:hypothetical protein